MWHQVYKKYTSRHQLWILLCKHMCKFPNKTETGPLVWYNCHPVACHIQSLKKVKALMYTNKNIRILLGQQLLSDLFFFIYFFLHPGTLEPRQDCFWECLSVYTSWKTFYYLWNLHLKLLTLISPPSKKKIFSCVTCLLRDLLINLLKLLTTSCYGIASHYRNTHIRFSNDKLATSISPTLVVVSQSFNVRAKDYGRLQLHFIFRHVRLFWCFSMAGTLRWKVKPEQSYCNST